VNAVSPTPDPLVFVREAVEDLHAYLSMWAARRPLPEPDPAARAAAGVAVERIDTAVRQLIELRSELVAEIRAEDAAWLALDDQDDNPDEG
jgi:hypothetical protein